MLTVLMGVSLLTRKFYVLKQRNMYFSLWQWLKSGFLMLAATAVLVFGLRIFYYSRFQGFGTILLLMILEALALGACATIQAPAGSMRHPLQVIGSLPRIGRQVPAVVVQRAFPLNIGLDAFLVARSLLRGGLVPPARIDRPGCSQARWLRFLPLP